ncbi:Crp/Fnr family transcriptional regulator [Brachyspira hampsonii]|uniref:Crp/Fnr family transcriptional regulator n=1 Tax=Brachyspira hampsonii TaxID=1287055 RepID=A0AAC9TTE7_9SPIR|nr:cyclic nucleotide-binding domain-containing protein [Brachyspira hampsonii]ASJ20409.1 Crp/Fnr family transcriptional regulator [Brachyspira hampsonii]
MKYPKSSIIFKNNKKPENYFYIIIRGKTISYNNFIKDSNFFSKNGDIIGLISSITNEPYFSSIEAIEDCELLEIKIENIKNINNKNIIKRISNYLLFTIEVWLSKYYSILINKKIDLYNKEDTLLMAEIYKNNGFEDACYKLCISHINIFKHCENCDDVIEFLKKLKPADEPIKVDKNIYKFSKGYCLYTELDIINNIYFIKSGKIGIYNIINSKQTAGVIYKSNHILNFVNPKLEYKPLFITAIVLEESVIEILTYNDFIKKLYTNIDLRLDYIKMNSIKIITAILKIKALNKKNIKEKIIVLIYSILKIETLFNDDIKIKLLYSLEDIKNMLNLQISNDEIYSLLKDINYIEINLFNNIVITNAKSYFDEYKDYTI